MPPEHVQRLSRLMTNYHKRGGHFRYDFSECVYAETERESEREGSGREKRESRGLMAFCQSSVMSYAPPGIYCMEKKKTKKKRVIVGLMV